MEKRLEVIFSPAKYAGFNDWWYLTDEITRETFSGTTLENALADCISQKQVCETLRQSIGSKRKLIDRSVQYTVKSTIMRAEAIVKHYYPFYWETPNNPCWYETKDISPRECSLKRYIKDSMVDRVILNVKLSYTVDSFAAPRTKKEYVSLIKAMFSWHEAEAEKYLTTNPW